VPFSTAAASGAALASRLRLATTGAIPLLEKFL